MEISLSWVGSDPPNSNDVWPKCFPSTDFNILIQLHKTIELQLAKVGYFEYSTSTGHSSVIFQSRVIILKLAIGISWGYTSFQFGGSGPTEVGEISKNVLKFGKLGNKCQENGSF